MDNKIKLEKEKETLLIPLFGKAKESKKQNPIIIDKDAAEIIKKIDYDFYSLKIADKTNTMMCLRAKLIDNFVEDVIRKDNSIVLHLGCGLDGRYKRINNPNVDWYDLDFEEVIEIRKQFFSETDKYHLISSSVTDINWVNKIPIVDKQYIVVAEGLFMYLNEKEIVRLLVSLRKRFSKFILIFDAFNTFTAKKVSKQPSLNQTGANIKWGIDDPNELSKYDPAIQFQDIIYLTSNKEIEKLSFSSKIIYKIANLFPFVRNSHRILFYKVW
ncbi:MAG: class I SAM-dependent methyltransferase [Ignavibacteria bacterium]|jgi:O-methyltransferase involved in polyketide biosynthesis